MTAEDLAKAMSLRQNDLRPALEATTRVVAQTALRRSKQLMSEQIYALPEDLTKKGEKRFARFRAGGPRGRVFVARKGDREWVRTGHLRRSEQVQIVGPARIIVKNTAIYAEPRHEAGKPGRRKINPARESHWQDDMARELRPIAQELWRETVREVMGRER